MMTLLREPSSPEEFNKHRYCTAFWQDNGTLIYVMPHGRTDIPHRMQRWLSLKLRKGPSFYIVGDTVSAIAQTAAFLFRFEKPTDESSGLEIEGCFGRNRFDFRTAGSRYLRRIIIEAVTVRPLWFHEIKFSERQSITLATRPHLIQLALCECEFEDEGTAFVDALERRTSSFGSLAIKGSTTLSLTNVKRLLQVDTVEILGLPYMDDDECFHLSLAAKVDRLNYEALFVS